MVCSPTVCYSPPTTDAWYFADYNIAQSIGIMAFGEYFYNYIDSKATSVIQCNKIYQATLFIMKESNLYSKHPSISTCIHMGMID